MKTLSVTKARHSLATWLARAVAGEDIGIIAGDHVVALRPVQVYSEDYALMEYGLSKRAMKSVARNLNRQARTDERKGRVKTWNGSAAGLRG